MCQAPADRFSDPLSQAAPYLLDDFESQPIFIRNGRSPTSPCVSLHPLHRAPCESNPYFWLASMCHDHISCCYIIISFPCAGLGKSPRGPTFDGRSMWHVRSHSASKALTERTKIQECAVLYRRPIIDRTDRESILRHELARWVSEWTNRSMCIFTSKGIPDN